jgi:hypothetical protein
MCAPLMKRVKSAVPGTKQCVSHTSLACGVEGKQTHILCKSKTLST